MFWLQETKNEEKVLRIVAPPSVCNVGRSQQTLFTGRNLALGSTQAGMKVEVIPGISTKFAVTTMNQRKYSWILCRASLVRVMAKATLVQLVAMVVSSIDVFCSWKK